MMQHASRRKCSSIRDPRDGVSPDSPKAAVAQTYALERLPGLEYKKDV
jgi:hypothetical protein